MVNVSLRIPFSRKTYKPCKLLPNPLGSHVKKHKLGIGNIAPKYRSQLKAINVAIVATLPVIGRKKWPK